MGRRKIIHHPCIILDTKKGNIWYIRVLCNKKWKLRRISYDTKKVTCKRCLKAINMKISETNINFDDNGDKIISPIVFDIETTGLYPFFGDRITCICAKQGDEELVLCEDDESIIIIRFFEWLQMHEGILITKNGKGFDVPFILSRIIENNMFTSYKLFKKLIEDRKHIDLQLITKKWISLDDFGKILGCKHFKIAKGWDAITFWRNGDKKRLIEYCKEDVLLTEEVYNKWVSLQ